jgi:hypothetical protein
MSEFYISNQNMPLTKKKRKKKKKKKKEATKLKHACTTKLSLV